MTERLVYEAPTLERIGTFESITQHASSGAALDAPFPTGTPNPQLTFSG